MSKMFTPQTTKKYLVIFLQVPINNVTDGFWRVFVYFNADFTCLISPGNAEAYGG